MPNLNHKPPTSQQERRIGFALYDGERPVVPFFALSIRPEDLTRSQASRTVVTQTLGGAWVDSHGAGLAQITLAGHTGWRFDLMGEKDGLGRFAELRDTVFAQWHQRRTNRRTLGQDPDEVELVFIDELDDIASIVVPMSFQLRRSRAQPLLQRYNISMTELRRAADAQIPPDPLNLSFMNARPVALEALQLSAENLALLSATTANNPIPAVAQLSVLADSASKVLNTVAGDLRAGISQQLAPAVFVATSIARASRNLTEAVIGLTSIPQFLLASVREISQTFQEAYCNLIGTLGRLGVVFDFSGLAGASNCSSTRGGGPRSPFLGVNVFEAVFGTSSPAPLLGPGGYDAVAAVVEQDPLDLLLMPLAEVVEAMGAISAGIGSAPLSLGVSDNTPTVGTRPEVAQALAAAPLIRTAPPVRRATVRRGDSIQLFALRELGDAGRWVEIVALNKLLPPYITQDAAAIGGRVAVAGQALLVPDQIDRTGERIAADDDSVYRRDLRLEDRDIGVSGGDLAIARGYKNLGQALRIRLESDEGDLIYHPGYGSRLRSLLGQVNSSTLGTLAQQFAERAIKADPRVDSVRDLFVSLEGDALTLTGNAVAVDAAMVPIQAQV